ncbi:MarR family transcriptional regulator [Arthrobacter sp. AZCC_0090]|uniref:MarR family transcriptional regulator n=1 Tax=Arthrobacter sp. AZCC_0090 TaxID=2735881 RepID=UPI00161AA8D7|nr:MarR family transcriptional regulator [Arthrobacter sp. AZCC_0090]MBB6406052.1 DNA-binding MarR family transcriptional regulator [Arthrobacter sp. AZCC_0090]
MENHPRVSAQRQDLLEAVFASGRELSTAAVMFHTKLSELRGLSATEGKAIDILLRFGPMTAGEFGERSGLAPASVTGLMQRLESKGVARRVRHEGDKRKVLIELVGDQVTAAMPHFVDFMGGLANLLEGYSDEELRVIADYSSKAARIQQDAAGRLGAAPGGNAHDDDGRAPSSNPA